MVSLRSSIIFWLALLAAFQVWTPLDANASGRRPASTLLAVSEKTGTPAKTSFRGDVYILRGGAGVFSTGLIKLADKLKQIGIAPTVISHEAWRLAAITIVQHQTQYGRRPVILIGHSLGADSALHIAQMLKKKGVEVDYIGSFAATGTASVPSNVRNVTNFYFKSGGWGAALTQESDFRGTLKNEDMSARYGVNHFTIDDNDALQNEVVRDVLRYARPLKSAQ
jgi:pimeloyl-ACP methyl ester carboxylesterase